MNTNPFPVAVYSPRALAVRPRTADLAVTAKDFDLAVRPDSLSLDTPDITDEPTVRARVSPIAVAAAVSAVLGFLHASGFFAGIVLGHIALVQIKRSRGGLRGRRLTHAALLVSWTPLVLVALVAVLMFLIGLHTTLNKG